jgi:ectoine hydroxylase-related dioxygenase (phytanoyl-CoA dioxygenase family)
MGCEQPVRRESAGFDRDHVGKYRRDGYAIVRGLFGASEIEAIAAAAEQVHSEGVAHGRSFRHGNLFYKIAQGPKGEPQVRMVQWFSYHQPVLNAVRLDRRIAAVLEPLIGGDLKQIINQIHWKTPGPSNDFAWHQDSRFREPADAYRNLADSYIQTGLAIDPHNPVSGGMRFIPGSHRRGDLGMDCSTEVLGTGLNDSVLESVGLSAADAVDLVLEPGDLAIWSPYLVHASGENRSDHRRRLYINGYVRAEDCDRGEWAFRGGRPVPLGPEPALVHYEELRERPEPHYV